MLIRLCYGLSETYRIRCTTFRNNQIGSLRQLLLLLNLPIQGLEYERSSGYRGCLIRVYLVLNKRL